MIGIFHSKTALALLVLLSLTACQKAKDDNPKQNDNLSEKITIFDRSLNSVTGPADEVALLKAFPRALYKIYPVKGLGSFYLDSRGDTIKNELRTGKKWEEQIANLIEQYVKPGSTVLDIGAHIGTHSLTMSKCLGDKGRVISFEPQLKLFSELAMNMTINKRSNVTAYRCALGKTFKSIEMNPAVVGNEGATCIGSGGDAVEMIPLDALNLDNVSLLKMDVENVEYDVLLGAEQTIQRNRPVMILEIMGNIYIPDRETHIQRTVKLVEDMGYQIKYIEGSWSDWLAIPLEQT